MKEQIFNDDFFKSNELTPEGYLLQKAIPTVEMKKTKAEMTKRTVPASVAKFKKEIESAFKTINDTIKDIQSVKKSDWQEEKCAKMLSDFYAFKSSFKTIVNDMINYPRSEEEIKKVPESEWDKSRIKI